METRLNSKYISNWVNETTHFIVIRTYYTLSLYVHLFLENYFTLPRGRRLRIFVNGPHRRVSKTYLSHRYYKRRNLAGISWLYTYIYVNIILLCVRIRAYGLEDERG